MQCVTFELHIGTYWIKDTAQCQMHLLVDEH